MSETLYTIWPNWQMHEGPLPAPADVEAMLLRVFKALAAEEAESGAGIARLPLKPVVDYSGWVDEMDLLPDED